MITGNGLVCELHRWDWEAAWVARACNREKRVLVAVVLLINTRIRVPRGLETTSRLPHGGTVNTVIEHRIVAMMLHHLATYFSPSQTKQANEPLWAESLKEYGTTVPHNRSDPTNKVRRRMASQDTSDPSSNRNNSLLLNSKPNELKFDSVLHCIGEGLVSVPRKKRMERSRNDQRAEGGEREKRFSVLGPVCRGRRYIIVIFFQISASAFEGLKEYVGQNSLLTAGWCDWSPIYISPISQWRNETEKYIFNSFFRTVQNMNWRHLPTQCRIRRKYIIYQIEVGRGCKQHKSFTSASNPKTRITIQELELQESTDAKTRTKDKDMNSCQWKHIRSDALPLGARDCCRSRKRKCTSTIATRARIQKIWSSKEYWLTKRKKIICSLSISHNPFVLSIQLKWDDNNHSMWQNHMTETSWSVWNQIYAVSNFVETKST